MSEYTSFLEKLKVKVQPNVDSNLEPPKLIQLGFLNDNELLEIKNKVLSLSEHWSYLNIENKSDIPTRMLPLGMYSRLYVDYINEVSKYKNLMFINFSNVYEKIRLKLSDYFQCNLSYHKDTHYPGFHIFVLNNDLEYGEYNWYNLHKDGFSFLSKFIQYENIYSCIIPIDLPRINGSLVYTKNISSSKNKLDDNVKYERIQYNIGDLLVWPGNLIHSIEPFVLHQKEYRITMQFHVATGKDNIIFW